MARKAQKPASREVPFQIRLTTEERRMFMEAAQRQHLTMSAWLRLAGLHEMQAQQKQQ